MTRTTRSPARLLALAATILAGVALADVYTVDWYTIDGGGETFCVGGDFELSGTVGQPDATTTVMAGGEFEISGGFWRTLRPAMNEQTMTPGASDEVDDQANTIPEEW
jgi:hypothetical protein